MSGSVAVFALLGVLLGSALAIGDDDLVTDLPGLIFETNFNTYSGYLNANTEGTWRMYYWLQESRSSPASDPLLVWIAGGPACSSVGSSFGELGAFYVNRDSQTLYENVYSWNQKANVLFLDSPVGAGFSYDTQQLNTTHATDQLTIEQSYAALNDFFKRVQLRYADRTFFIAGESYAGVYLPMLADRLVNGINSGDFTNTNFQGVAVGNGFLNVQHVMNSEVLFSYHHGRISLEKWERIKTECCNNTDVDSCLFSDHISSPNGVDFDTDNSECGVLIYPLLTLPDFMDQYNYYQDCYDYTTMPALMKQGLRNSHTTTTLAYQNTADSLNYDTTDNQNGYPCWQVTAMKDYINRPDVLDALHIANEWRSVNTWDDCNWVMYSLYNGSVRDTTPYFQSVFDNVKKSNFRFLLYSGDTDLVCPYLGNEWHARDVAQLLTITGSEREPWTFRGQHAGFLQRYANGNGAFSIDALTVKGSGHFVPNDRPGPSLQMITNFMFASNTDVNYSSTAFANVTPKPANLLPGFNGSAKSWTRSLLCVHTCIVVFAFHYFRSHIF